LMIFILVIDDAFTVNEETAALWILKHTNPGKNFFLAENGTLASLEMSW
jgi:hypothetical protein